jgi:shikimate dehydrogenase
MAGPNARRLAVIGHPVAHSLSPAMHTAAFRALGVEGEWSYEAIDMDAGEFAERTAALGREGFAGANVTVPHKAAALGLADRASDAAQRIGAANTLVFTDEDIRAENTDAPGFLEALPEAPKGKTALVLGAGGSARAVVWALAEAGAKVSVWNRTEDRGAELAEEFGVSHVAGEAARPASGEVDLIVNCTTAGLPGSGAGLDALPVAVEELGGRTVVDLAYGEAPTELVEAATGAGATVVDGLEVLVRQGALSFRIWTGLEPPLDAMRAAVRA